MPSELQAPKVGGLNLYLGLGLLVAAWAIYSQWPELRRYARMKRM